MSSRAVELLRGRLARAGRLGAVWARRRVGGNRVLPDFIIVGAQKSGTSSLYRYIAGHPDVRPAMNKELHFFDREYARGLDWYRANFPRARGRVITGEATPFYMYHPLVAERVCRALPKVKIIGILRDPVLRAWSHYHHEVSRGRETLSFAGALDSEVSRLEAERDVWSNGEWQNSYARRHYSYVSRGLYADQLAGWMRWFRREQMLLMKSEDLFRDPAGACRDVFEFLGLSACIPEVGVRHNSGRYRRDMDSESEARLRALFEEPNARLGALVGWDTPWT